ncbi:hypothetical protein V5P93_002958 [Actinokineospora auranticolor]|uniref:hypothetical protein n=1 Tax=Actinokineospora auranticolor TaxID=155976 RepID=UPI0035A828FD
MSKLPLTPATGTPATTWTATPSTSVAWPTARDGSHTLPANRSGRTTGGAGSAPAITAAAARTVRQAKATAR